MTPRSRQRPRWPTESPDTGHAHLPALEPQGSTSLLPSGWSSALGSQTGWMRRSLPNPVTTRRDTAEVLQSCPHTTPCRDPDYSPGIRPRRKIKWWPETESNRRHGDFQSPALPTELSGRFDARFQTNKSTTDIGTMPLRPAYLLHQASRVKGLLIHPTTMAFRKEYRYDVVSTENRLRCT